MVFTLVSRRALLRPYSARPLDFEQALLITMMLGICGSPRKKATEYVLAEALSMLEKMGFETERAR